MPLQMFPLLLDNTRLIRFKDTLYKVKVKYKLATFPAESLNISQEGAHNQIEEVFRAVLYISERNNALKTIETPNFLIKTYKIPWSFPSKCSDYVFQQNGKSLKVFDHMFEFHISNKGNGSKNRSREKMITQITHVDKRLDDSDRQYQAEKMGCKPALVILSDLNLGTHTRFGRTKDGQLYKMGTGNADRHHRVTNSNTNESARVSDKVILRHSEEVTEKIDSKVNGNGTHLRNDEVVHETVMDEMQLTGDNANGDIPSKYTKRTDNKSGRIGKVENSSVLKAKPHRDKHSLRESELKALDYENIQMCRLRSRRPSNEKNLSFNLREQANAVKYTESESSQTGAESSQTEAVVGQGEAESSQTEAEGSQSEAEGSQCEAEKKGGQNRNNRYRTKRRTRRKILKISKNKRKRNVLSMRKQAKSNKKRKSEQTESDSDVEGGVNVGTVLCRARQENKSSSLMTSSGSESRHSPRKGKRSNEKRKIESLDSQSDDEKSASQESGRSKKVKLYDGRNSPQVITGPGSNRTVEVCSPRVSTVLPLKRSHVPSSSQASQRLLPPVTSPRLTRQSLSDVEARRIASLREERPSQIYRDIMLSQRRDRHLVEQAENAETDKLRQLYEPTVPRRSPRLNREPEAKRRRSSGLWGKIMEALVTPTKKYMFGNKK